MQNQGILIGVAGASGSGKTLVTNTIFELLGSDRVIVIQEDAYYKDLDHLPLTERAGINFDHPDAFDHDLMVSQLQDLKSGKVIEHPVYDYATHTRTNETRQVGPHEIVIVEGILTLAVEEIRDLLDIKIFIETDLDICLLRRLKRDITKRGRSVESVMEQYQETVRPMFLQFIEPSKQYADIIIPRGGRNTVAVDMVTTKIEQLLSAEKTSNTVR